MFDNGVCNPTLFEGEPYFFFKEPHFFDRNERFEEGISFYSKRFEQCVDVGLDRFIMDATPNTFEYPDRVHEIYSLPEARGRMKKVKIMLVLRDPIDRDLSAYNHKVFDYKAIIENDPNFDAEGTFYQDTVHAGGAIKNFTEFGQCSIILTLILMRLTVCGLTNVFFVVFQSEIHNMVLSRI